MYDDEDNSLLNIIIMDAKAEIKKWKAEFALANTKEERTEYDKRFKTFLSSLSPAEKKEFAQAYREGTKNAIDEAKKIARIIERKKDVS